MLTSPDVLRTVEKDDALWNRLLGWVDADGDGLEDLYVCDGGGLPNRLYLQNADGTVRDASAESGADWLEESKSALFLDLDNDGDQDLVVAPITILVFAENNGRGIFTMRGGHLGAPYPTSISAFFFYY